MKACPSFEAALAQLSKNGNKSNLKVQFSESTTVNEPGVKLSSAATKTTPTLSISSSLIRPHAGDKYVVVCLDLDAPFPSFSALGPAAHWIEFDLIAIRSALEDFTPFESTSKSVMYYAGPGPPPPSAPHRYVFLVWEQPDGMSADVARKTLGLGESPGIMARMRWDQPQVEKKIGLGQPLAVNYFTANSE